MKRFLPWLLVPAAAWLGHRSALQPDLPAAVLPQPEVSLIARQASVLAEADSAALRQHADDLFTEPENREKQHRLRLVCARWAELDPAAGLAWAAERDEHEARQLRHWIFLEWALLDSSAAWAAIPEGPEGDPDRHAVTALLLHENPGLFMDWFRRVKKPTPDESPAWLRIAERHADELEEIAMAGLQELERPQGGIPPDIRQIFHLLARHRAGKDPAAAFDWAAGLPENLRRGTLHAVLDTWATSDPMAAWKKLTSLQGEFAILDVIGDTASDSVGAKILARIGKDNPAAALQLILDVKQGSSTHFFGGISSMTSLMNTALSCGGLDPVEAYRLLSQAKGRNSNLPLNVFPRIWFGLPQETLENAARGILAEPPAHHRETALQGIAAAWFAGDPQEAIAFISAIEDDSTRRKMLVGGFRDVIGSNVDPQTQAYWLALVPENDRASIAASLISRYGVPRAGSEGAMFRSIDRSQADLLAPLLRDLPASPELTRAAEIASIAWAASAPAEALAWADSLVDPAARTAAYSGTFDTWAYHDPAAAATWLMDREPGAERDAATLPLVRRLGDSDPEGGWAWAAAIGDPALQTEARIAALRAWSKQSPEDAHAALQGYLSTLSPAQAAAFTQSFFAE